MIDFASGVRMALSLACLSLLVACAAPQQRVLLSSDGLRPGVDSARNFNDVRPVPGQRVVYRYDGGGSPFEVRGSWRIARAANGNFALRGQIERIIPGIDLEATAREFAERFGEGPLRAEGDRLISSFDALVDGRMRTISTRSPFENADYRPNDCFATLGLCRFVQRRTDGAIRYIVAETTETDGIWREIRRLDPEKTPGGRNDLTMEVVYTVDRQALLIDATIADYDFRVPQITRIRRLR